MATDNSPVVTEEKLLYFYNTYLKPYINAESGGHAIKNENDLLPLEQRETMVLNTPLMGSDDSTNEATVLDVDTNVDLSVIHAPGMAGNVEGHIYSTEEHVVGKWINGKPIYEKTIDIAQLPNNNIVSYPTNISNIDIVVEIKGITKGNASNSFLPIPSANPNSVNDNLYINYQKDTNSIRIYTKVNLSGDGAYVTMRYTKTTDTV